MSRTTEQRLDTTTQQLNIAFDLINELWTNNNLNLLLDTPELTETERQVREIILSTRLAIMNASNELTLLRIQNER
jgi:hypothetical protein